ncbi:homogentisate 1,2-dioxygenase, partial [Cladophialophora psammophila CBS 110553]
AFHKFRDTRDISVQTGFLANVDGTEAIPRALLIGQNIPQKSPHGLYAEKGLGTSLAAPRWENQQTWVYCIIPSASHATFDAVPCDNSMETTLIYISVSSDGILSTFARMLTGSGA